MITSRRLKQLIKYDPLTGVFTWKISTSNVRAGAAAGSLNKLTGYVEIGLEKKLYKAHRLAFLYMTGKWPKILTDHKDRNKANNRWMNLREATESQNRINISWDNRGISLVKNKWRARIKKDQVDIHIGYYQHKKEAVSARKAKEAELFGEFAIQE